MKFSWCTLQVNNMQESLDFYEGFLGLKVQQRFNAGPNTEIVFLGEEGQAQIELICNGQQEDIPQRKGIGIKLGVMTDDTLEEVMGSLKTKGVGINFGFVIDNTLEEIMETLQSKGIKVVRGPMQPNPHIRFLFVHDPNGYEIQLAQQL